jgi:hypothetical protein
VVKSRSLSENSLSATHRHSGQKHAGMTNEANKPVLGQAPSAEFLVFSTRLYCKCPFSLRLCVSA